MEQQAWHRLERVIRWTGLSTNSFALTIGLKRSENLYQIKKGNNGISRDLAALIATQYPCISRGWLLSGEGEMMLSAGERAGADTGIPFYSIDAIAVGQEQNLPSPRYYINLPPFIGCTFAALNGGNAMSPDIPAGSILILKKVEASEVIPGESYLILTPSFRGVRIVRQSDSPENWLLLPRNTASYDPIQIERSSIRKLFLVRGVIIEKNL